ncbi:unnamed protein product [Cercospora beticola]|nr:unnamed protein product [Cercospora beticola]
MRRGDASGIGLKKDRDPRDSPYQHEEVLVETMNDARRPMRRRLGHSAALPVVLLCRFMRPLPFKCPGRRRQNDDTSGPCMKAALSMNAREEGHWRHSHGMTQGGWS